MDRKQRTIFLAIGAALLALIVIVVLINSGGTDTAIPTTTASTVTGAASSTTTGPTATTTPLDFSGLSDLSGVYVGQWDSATFGGGGASIAIDVNVPTGTIGVEFGLEGQLLETLITQIAPTDGAVNVMGGVDAVFTESGTASGTGTIVGDYEMTLSSSGEVVMTAGDVPGPHVDEIEVGGTLEPDCFTLDYRITFEGTDTVFEGSIELCRTEDGGIIIDDDGTAVPTQTFAEYNLQVLDQSAVDAVGGVGMATASLIFECADGRCDGSIAIGQITYPDGTAQRGGFREFTYDSDAGTYVFDETLAGSCERERWYGTITPTGFDDRGPTAFRFSGGHDGSGGCDYQLVYEISATRVSVSP